VRVILRSVLALFLGLFVGIFLTIAVEIAGQVIYPIDIDHHDPEAAKEVLADAPVVALLFVLAAWTIGAAGGASTAALLAPKAPVIHGLVIGGLFMLVAIHMLTSFEHPLWFQVVGILVFLPAAYFGARRASRGRRMI
jgi:hypothetical protein